MYDKSRLLMCINSRLECVVCVSLCVEKQIDIYPRLSLSLLCHHHHHHAIGNSFEYFRIISLTVFWHVYRPAGVILYREYSIKAYLHKMQACVKITCIFCLYLCPSHFIFERSCLFERSIRSTWRWKPTQRTASRHASSQARREIYVCTYSPNVPPAPDTSSVTHTCAHPKKRFTRTNWCARAALYTFSIYSY